MKSYTEYICQQCGYKSSSFLGKCPECGEWNSLVETQVSTRISNDKFQISNSQLNESLIKLSEVKSEKTQRISTGFSEFDRVLGGGIVGGSIVLIAGEPGIGKSTLLLQTAIAVASSQLTVHSSQKKNKAVNRQPTTDNSSSVLYVTGEESPQQVKIRADRLVHSLQFTVDGLSKGKGKNSVNREPITDNLFILAQTDVEIILSACEKVTPAFVIVDSIQTLTSERLTGSAGSIGQVRECAQILQRYAKAKKVPVFIVGHVTKEGGVAGPKVLEHLVDAVISIEGDNTHAFRLVRALKNRFGSTFEVGVFEMQDVGMVEVANPSQIFLSQRIPKRAGSVVLSTVAGGRPLMCEVQALVTSTIFGVPARRVTGLDFARMQIVIASLSRVAKLSLGNLDVYLNVAGGLKINEPAADLAAALAIASATLDKPIEEKICVFGEVGLLGELREVSFSKNRISEAKRLGFADFVHPGRFKTLDAAIEYALSEQ